jgi:hypothetical protein
MLSYRIRQACKHYTWVKTYKSQTVELVIKAISYTYNYFITFDMCQHVIRTKSCKHLTSADTFQSHADMCQKL